MKLIRQSWSFEEPVDGMAILKKIERAGRTCYKSEDMITDTSAIAFCKRILKSGHHSVIEHHSLSARFVTNRGVTHELVRHRLCAFSQESTRYCNYGGNDIVFIWPVWMDGLILPPDDLNLFADSILAEPIPYGSSDIGAAKRFLSALVYSEKDYKSLLNYGWTPQQAREVLPNALKTEIVVTANIREWRHIFNLRCSAAAHPQIRALMLDALGGFSKAVPGLFDDLVERYLPKVEE